MLKTPKVRGLNQLRLFVEEMGFRQACRAIAVHETTMRRWLRGQVEPPISAIQALYWLSSYGFSDAAAEVHWSHQFLLSRVRQLESELAFSVPETWQASNEDAYAAPGLQLSLVLTPATGP